MGDSAALKAKSVQLWREYEKLIMEVFNFYTKNGKPFLLEQDSLLSVLESTNEEDIERFNKYVENQISYLLEAKDNK